MNAKSLTRVMLVLEKLREDDPQIPMPHALALLVVARQPGVSQRELGRLLGLSKSASQRIFGKLSPEGIEGREGLGWIVFQPGDDARERLAHLTPKGQRLVSAIENIMEL